MEFNSEFDETTTIEFIMQSIFIFKKKLKFKNMKLQKEG